MNSTAVVKLRGMRTATESDKPAVAALWRLAWHSAHPEITTLAPPAHWLHRVNEEFIPPTQTLVLDMGRGLAGFCNLDPGQRYLHQLFIHPDHQGQGIGTRIVQSLGELFPQGWSLHVAQDNPRAQRLYERLGLRAQGISCNPVTGRTRIEYVW